MVIDSHIHTGPLPGYMNYDTDTRDLIGLMDQLDIVYAVNSNHRDLIMGDLQGAAKENIMLYEETKGRIMSYFAYDPFRHDECMEVIDRYYDNKIFKGVKIHPSFNLISADDDRYESIWDHISRNGMVMMSHTWDISLTNPVQKYSYPAGFEKYIARYPRATIIFAHSGGRYGGMVKAVDIAGRYRNVYLDLAGDIYADGFIEYAVSQLGSERILFGSDYSMMDQRNMLGIVLGADISITDKENILWRNAADLFGIDI